MPPFPQIESCDIVRIRILAKNRNGLYKLTEARTQVEEMSVELEVKQDVVAKKQKECQELLVVIVEKRMAADEQQKQV